MLEMGSRVPFVPEKYLLILSLLENLQIYSILIEKNLVLYCCAGTFSLANFGCVVDSKIDFVKTRMQMDSAAWQVSFAMSFMIILFLVSCW